MQEILNFNKKKEEKVFCKKYQMKIPIFETCKICDYSNKTIPFSIKNLNLICNYK